MGSEPCSRCNPLREETLQGQYLTQYELHVYWSTAQSPPSAHYSTNLQIAFTWSYCITISGVLCNIDRPNLMKCVWIISLLKEVECPITPGADEPLGIKNYTFDAKIAWFRGSVRPAMK